VEAGKQQRLLLFHVLNWNGEKGRVLAEEMSAYNGYETTSDIGYPTPGSFGSYVEAKGIAMVTLEMPIADAAACWTHNRSALLAAIHLPLGRSAHNKHTE
jgi:protein MpaA